jgi:hypothetical protein
MEDTKREVSTMSSASSAVGRTMSAPITYGQTSRGFEVTFEGRTIITSRPTVAELRESIAQRAQRIEEETRRLRMLTALADAMEADQAVDAERKRTERNAKASATRARNADPFGFAAMEAQAVR